MHGPPVAGGLAVELAVQDVAGALTAVRCGADRVELCSGLALGGLTPSTPLVEAVVATGISTHVLVRPRSGGFTYDAAEVDLLLAEVRTAVAAGASGVVVGVLAPAGPCGLDDQALLAVRRAADGVELTFHRALDVLLATGGDGREVLGHLHRLGVDRVLTSGGAARAVDALDVLASLVDAAAGRVEVMAGAGVRARDVAALTATGVDALHASAGVHQGAVAGEHVTGLGGDLAPWHGRPATDPAIAAELVRAVRRSVS